MNQNTIKKIILEIAWYQFVIHRKFMFSSQNIIKSHKFFEYISYLDRSGFININNINHHMTYYTLTDNGKLLAIIYSKMVDSDRKYKVYNQELTWF